jgi:hypothetical protein
MADDKILSATLDARESITSSLSDIERGAEDSADAFDALSESGTLLGSVLDVVENNVDALSKSLDELPDDALGAVSGLSAVESVADEAGDEFAAAKPPTDRYGAALDNLSTDAIESVAPQYAAAGAADEVGDEAGESAEEVGILSAALDALSVPSVGSLSVGTNVEDMGRPSMPSVPEIAIKSRVKGALDGFSGSGGDVPDMEIGADEAREKITRISSALREMPDLDIDGVESTAALTSHLEENVDEAGDEAVQTAAQIESLDSELGGLVSRAIASSRSLHSAADAADEYGDEARQATTETGFLSAAMRGLGGAGTGLSGKLGPVGGSLSTIAAFAALSLPLIFSLSGALGALGIAAGGAGGVLATLFGAGLLEQGEALVGTTQMVGGELQQIETAGQGVSAIFSDIKGQAKDMLSPLQTAETANFTQGLLQGGLSVLQDFVTMAERLMGPIFDMTDRLGAAWNMEQPAFFGELEALIRSILPYVEAFAMFFIRNMPDALAWFREEGADLLPMLANLADSLVELSPHLAELGTAVLKYVIPTLAGLIDLVVGAFEWFDALPGPVKDVVGGLGGVAAAALTVVGALAMIPGSGLVFKALAAGVKLLGGVLSGLSISGVIGSITSLGSTAAGAASTIGSLLVGAITSLAAVVGWPVVVIGALTAAVGGVITYFGWWDDIMNAVTGTLSWFGGLLDWIIGGIASTAINLAGLVGLGDETEAFFKGVGEAANEWIGWAIDKLKGFVDWAGKAYDKAAGFLDHMAGSTDEWVGSLTGGGDDDDGDGSGGGGGSDDGGGYDPWSGGGYAPGGGARPTAAAAGSGGWGGYAPGGDPRGQYGPAGGSSGRYGPYQQNEVNVDARGSTMNGREVESIVERVLDRRFAQDRKRNYPNT